ncbi:MAG: DNA-3-methyladenine glycosylase I [Bdellovibrionota bacterium]
MQNIVKGEDGKLRCKWSGVTPDYIHYHDNEWGFPVKDDRKLFEKICLEGFQSGLSWRTILTKRENFRKAFQQFDFHKIARFGEKDVKRLLADEGIVRHRGKIEAVIHNAKMVQLILQEYGSLSVYIWSFEPKKKSQTFQTVSTSLESIALSKDLKKRGWKFVGPTTVYAFMQAMGLINDHAKQCFVRKEVDKTYKKFKKPVIIKR